jgi:sugar-specific transcriptional regulator TrmB
MEFSVFTERLTDGDKMLYIYVVSRRVAPSELPVVPGNGRQSHLVTFYNQLEQLGVPENISKIYVALLGKREMSAMEIHEATGVPRSKIYEIAQKMMQRGMCIEKKTGRSKKYQAIEPERVFENLIRESEAEFKKKKESAETMIDLLSPIYSKGLENTDISEYVEVIKDLSSIHERYVGLVASTTFELLGFVKPPHTTQNNGKKLAEQEVEEAGRLSKGVDVKVLYEYTMDEAFGLSLNHIERCIAAGEQARFVPQLPIKMYVFDRKFVLMAMSNGESASSPLTMLVVEHSAWANAAKMLFDHLWENAIDMEQLKALSRELK